MTRRRLLALAAAGSAVALLAACGTNAAAPTTAATSAPAGAPTTAPAAVAATTAPAGNAAAPTTAAAAPTTAAAAAPTTGVAAQPVAVPTTSGKVTLTLWTHNYQPLVNYINKKIPQYKQQNPNVTINYSDLPVPDHEQRILTTLAAKAGFADGFNEGDQFLPLYMSKGWLAEIPADAFGKSSTEDLQGLFFDYSLRGLVQQGKLFAIPFEWNALSLYYNRKEFTAVGLDPDKPPQDWNAVTDAATKLTTKDSVGNLTRPGFQQNYGPGTEWPLRCLDPMIQQLGGSMLSPDGMECWLNKPESIQAIQLYTDWTKKYKVSKEGFTVPGVTNNFATGNTSMQESGPYNPASIKVSNPAYKYKEDWDVTNFPQWPAATNKKTVSGLWRYALFLASFSKNQLEMAKFYSFIMSDYKGVYADAGYLPSLKGWQDDPFFKDYPWIPIQMKDLEVAVPISQTPKYPEMAQQVLEMKERIETGQESVQDSVNEATQKINAALKSS